MSSALEKSPSECTIVCALRESGAKLSKQCQRFGLGVDAVPVLVGDIVSKLVEATREEIRFGDSVEVRLRETLLQSVLGLGVTCCTKSVDGESECCVE
jgi:hypothetical protein